MPVGKKGFGALCLGVYDRIVVGIAMVGGLLVALIFGAVIYDALLRDLGLQPTRWAVPLSEYGLLYVTMLPAPWLLRSKGQVLVETLRHVVPPWGRVWLERVTYVLCIAICGTMTWASAAQAIDSFERGDVDRLAITIPLYAAHIPFIIGFFFLGCEFFRFLVGVDSLYAQDVTARDSI
jgi:C4-dicarboxylate transporter, DctQ subunit